ncbi:hypothetical protein Cni_G05180 [Canna indica]|uniref:RING-type domain-containing protein n=1 Tax=Canna indica TaxID=4628 RepID=A0AAQ3Q3H6_9LILI|nr:hypothetical protein Cni_G05180 [Canna indica]
MSSHTLLKEAEEAHSRRLLSDPPSSGSIALGPSSASPGSTLGSLDANVIMILAVLVCSVICVLAVHTTVRCALAVLSRSWAEPDQPCGLEECAAGGRVRRTALPVVVYCPGLGVPRAGTECAICLSEFKPSERIRVLPECNHGFHVGCIDRWLMSRASCPTCRHSLHLYVV